MSTPHEDARLRNWLRDQEATPPYLDEILARTARQRQRRGWGAVFRPSPGLPAPAPRARVALAAALVVLLISATAVLAPGRTSPSVGAFPSDPPATGVTPDPGLVGTVLRNTAFEAPFSITIPDGWTVNNRYERDVFVALQPGAEPSDDPLTAVDLVVVDDVAADPCVADGRRRQPPIGESAADLAEWLLSIDQLRASTPVPVGLAGLNALRIDEAFLGSPSCPEAWLWHNETGYVFPDEAKRYYIFEVGRVRVVAAVVRLDPSADTAMAEAVVRSLKFE